MVGYPIVKLAKPSELVGFVRELENGLIEVCKELSIPAFQIAGRTGIWVGLPGLERKIAAIGIRVASGVSMHVFAINVNPNLSAFDRIIPCVIVDVTVTSISQELKKDVSVNQILPIVEKHISQSLAKVSALQLHQKAENYCE